MRQKERVIEIIGFLMDQPKSSYTTSKQLATYLQVSTKTVFNDLRSDYMKKLLGQAEIEKKEHVGIRLNAEDGQRRKLSNILYERSSESMILGKELNDSEDVEKTCLALLKNNRHISKEKLATLIFKDVSSMDIVLRDVSLHIQKYRLQLARKSGLGIALLGDEADIRELFKALVLQNVIIDRPDQLAHREAGFSIPIKKRIEAIFTKEIVMHAIEIVNRTQVNLNEKFTDYDYEILITKVCIIITLVELGKKLTTSKIFTTKIREHLVAHLMMFQLNEIFHFGYDTNEHHNLTELLLSTRRIGQTTRDWNNPLPAHILEQFIMFVGSSLSIDLTNDEELSLNLSEHIQPAIRRVRHGIRIENPLLKQIQLEYTNTYIAVLTGIEVIEKSEKIHFNEHEIGFICLHIVAAVNRSSKERFIRGILICEGGQAVSSFLSSKIEKQFSEIAIKETMIADKLKKNNLATPDVIFNATNAKITYEKVPILTITNLLDQENISAIRKWIVNREYEKLYAKKNRLKDSFMYFRDAPVTKEELIIKYSSFLEQNDYVTDQFATSAIEREKTIPTALGRGIALPHGSSDYVKKSCILIIQLEEPILWGSHMADLVFLTAINQNEIDEHRVFFNQLFHIISDEHLLSEIKSATDIEKFQALLFKEPQ